MPRPAAPDAFAVGLATAIAASGLSLDRVQHRLAQRGVQVSLSTLSYWRRGRSRPERAESLRAVRALEEALDLQPGSLLALLGPPRPRGRWLSQPCIGLEQLWEGDDADDLLHVLARIDLPAADRLSYLSVHDEQIVGPDRRETLMRSRGVVRAETDGVDRTVAVYRAGPGDHGPARIRALSQCRLGRTRTHEASKFTVAEVIFDRVLRKGDTAVFSYETVPAAAVPGDCCERRFNRPIPQYVLNVEFHPDAVPARCVGYARDATEEGGTEEELWIGTTHSAHVVAHQVQPGLVGIRWEWDDNQRA
jgi:hypothetical protein